MLEMYAGGQPAPGDRLSAKTGNALKIGLFGANCSSGRAVTKVPERWSGTWPDNLRLGLMADDAGIDFMLPIGRWKGYGGETDYQGATLETITWATALLARTRRMTVFGTVHAPLFHPLIAAKEMVTADLVAEGRFGLNIVVGWNEDEFAMFGVAQRDHETRYTYAQEWLDAIKQAWSRQDTFDFNGQFFKLQGVRAFPKPYGGSRPVIMNAGISPTGQAFAVRNCDAFFMQASRVSVDETQNRVAGVKALAHADGRDIDIYTVGVVTCRPTCGEAEDYHRHCVVDEADWSAVDAILALRDITPTTVSAEEFVTRRREFANGNSGLPIIGDPEQVASQLAALARAGLTGIAISFVNYADELPFFCDEVLPRLRRMGLRMA